MLLGSINFAQIFPQFRWNVVQLQFGVNVLFAFAGDYFFVVQPRQAVFAEGVAHLERPLTQGNVMRFAAGEVLHGRAERLGRQKANVHLHAATHAEAHFVFAPRNDVHQPRQLDDVINQFLPWASFAASFAGDQNVEVADGLTSAPQRASRRDLLDSGESAQMLGDLLRLGFRCVQQKTSGDAAIVFEWP